LILTDHQYAKMGLDWFLAVSNVGLTYLFVLEFGILGAALGTALAISLQNGVQVLLLRRFEGLWPFDRSFLIPAAGGAAMVGVMWIVRLLVEGPIALAVGAVVGAIVYGLVLRATGLNPRDRLVMVELWTRYRRTLASALR
jgi:O-antigen/teichoic acid export membrane protein